MPPIIEYTDYRRYIADFYAERKNRLHLHGVILLLRRNFLLRYF